ncbi:Flp pilus assembly protein TadB [Paenibacillus sp. PastF-3]|uniref:hypothetical protein n=1 Tax=unclassified Paenibacillus TaxID=185978 RepID=UPI000B9FEFEF|nr:MULTISPECIES: hypothetical protein [unclassified Paenibacillus]MDH6372927.1 Flp pilus assembly protein TadB [Paenibacillus sp. PastF-3]OZQ77342.1 hypothetical protein CA598_29875 [Paenibacillus sp. VTT E-133291]
MLQYVIALLFLLVLYWAFASIFVSEKKYRSQAYVTNGKQATWKQVAEMMEGAAKRKVKLSHNQKDVLEKMLYRVGWKEAPEDIAAQQLMLGGIAMVGLSLFGIFSGSTVLLFFAVVAGFVFYRYPVNRLKKAVAYKEKQASIYLPDFIELLILLFSAGLTPYEAIKRATEQSPDVLRLDCERLSNDLDIMTEQQALNRFAENVGIGAAKRFVFAMKQAMDMSKKEANQIFNRQSVLMREMRIQNQRKIIKERPARLQLISSGVYAFVLLLPIAIIGVAFVKSMGAMI